MRRAALLGYFGQKNAGDDAFLRISDWAVRRVCGATVVMASMPAPPPWGAIVPLWFPDGKPAIWRFKEAFESTLCWRVPHVVFAGGSNLHSSNMLGRFVQLVRRAGGGPHFAVGIGVGPFRDRAAERLCGELLGMLSFVGCRDEQSYERARALAPSARVELTADIAPLLPVVAAPRAHPTAARRGLGVVLCPYERVHGGDVAREQQRLDTVADAVAAAARRGAVDEIVLVDMNSHPVKGDVVMHDVLEARLATTPVAVRRVRYAEDPIATLDVIAGLRSIVTMRLHGAVFAYCAGTPAVVLAYHEKSYGWATSVGYPDALVVNAVPIDPEALAAAIALITGDADAPSPTLPLADAQRLAWRNWAWLPGAARIDVGTPANPAR
jgi:polysaccharide pyruvyl transferase WcaK-like protein